MPRFILLHAEASIVRIVSSGVAEVATRSINRVDDLFFPLLAKGVDQEVVCDAVVVPVPPVAASGDNRIRPGMLFIVDFVPRFA